MKWTDEFAPKKWLKRAALSAGYRISKLPGYEVKGFSVPDDMAVLMPGKSPVCLDVGANVGQTISMLVETLDDPVIHAFEPSTEVHAGLARLIASSQPAWRNVHLHKLALGKERANMEFRNYENSQLSSLLELADHGRNPFLHDRSRVAAVEVVEVDTLDSFVQKHNLQRIDLLKIDTQGFDLNVLKGAEGTFACNQIHNVFLEMNFTPLYDGQGTPSEMIQFLAQRGLGLIDIYEKYRASDKPHLAWCSALFSRS